MKQGTHTETGESVVAGNDSGEFARAALASMSDAACLVDATGGVRVNDAFLHLHRYVTPDERPRTVDDLFATFELRPLEDASPLPIAEWPACRALAGDGGTGIEYHVRRRGTGETWTTSFSFAPIRLNGTHITGAIVTARDVTEAYSARRALEANRERLRLVLDSTSAAVWEIDLASGAIVAGSSNWMERYGYAAADVPRTFAAWLALAHTDDQPRVEEAMDALRAGRKTWVMVEYRLRTPTQWRWVQSRAMVSAQDELGHPRRLMGIHLDIHERRETDEALLENERRLHTVFEANDIGMWDWSLAEDGIEMNSRMAEMLGYAPTELPDRGAWLGILHPEDFAVGDHALREHLAGRRPFYSAEIRLRAKGGDWRWMYTRGQVVQRDARGRALRLMGISLDVTERKQTELALAASETRLRAVVDNIPVGIVLSDGHGVPVFANEYFRGRMHLSEQESLALAWLNHMPATDREEMGRQLRGLLDGQADEFFQEFDYHHPAHEPARMRTRIIRVDAPHADFRFIGIGEDITLERAQENEHRRLLRQVQQAQKMEAIGQLAGGIAHDFNNVLTAVVGFSQLAKDRFATDTSSKLGEYLSAVSAAGERGRELVAKLLAFSRREPSGKHHAVDALRVAEEVATMLSAVLPSFISLNVVADGPAPQVRIDAIDLHQMLVNLAVNARDAIEGHGAITITIAGEETATGFCTACQTRLDGQRYVAVGVRDTGSGMSAEVLARIFEPFFTTKAVGQGTGMGLAVVHGVLHQAGGHLLVRSTPGLGTEFRLLLRASESDDSDALEGSREHEAAPIARLDFAGLRVLVVDDEPAIRAFVSDVLESVGAVASTAQDGHEALQCLQTTGQAFDVIFTDQTMPRLTGIELLAAVRAAGLTTPVILTSGYSDASSRRAVADQGATFLAKPAGPDDILAALSQALAR